LILRAFLLPLLGMLIAGPANGADGESQFKKLCGGCHKADGTGVPGFGPPLKDGLKPMLETGGGTSYVAYVLIGGLSGPIESMGKRYSGVMPSFAAQSDETLLAVLTHVVGTLNGFTPPDASALASARADKPTPKANHDRREKLLGAGA
jgi:mono/diheme cytochrome c family protein